MTNVGQAAERGYANFFIVGKQTQFALPVTVVRSPIFQGSASGTVAWAGTATGGTPHDITVTVGPSRVDTVAADSSRQALAIAAARLGSTVIGSSRQAWDIETSKIDREP